MVSTPRAITLLLVYAGWTLALLPVQMVAVAFDLRLARRIPMLYHRGTCRILGMEVRTAGKPAADGPTLFVSNHASYLDISVLGALIAGSFVAKREVTNWPIYGYLARLQRSVFIDRRAMRTAGHRDEMVERMMAGDNLILFPEGTSSDGNRVLPFKSGLFGVAESRPGREPVAVQPVSIAYTSLNSIPLGRDMRPYFAWYGDMEMASHIWAVLGLGRATAVVTFHEPVTIDAFESRKALSEYCRDTVAAGVSQAIGGRLGGTRRAWGRRRGILDTIRAGARFTR